MQYGDRKFRVRVAQKSILLHPTLSLRLIFAVTQHDLLTVTAFINTITTYYYNTTAVEIFEVSLFLERGILTVGKLLEGSRISRRSCPQCFDHVSKGCFWRWSQFQILAALDIRRIWRHLLQILICRNASLSKLGASLCVISDQCHCTGVAIPKQVGGTMTPVARRFV